MPDEPRGKRTIAFFDGQNLFSAAKEAFGYRFANYDPKLLAQSVCDSKEWQVDRVYFYTGVPSHEENPRWHGFWSNKVADMGKRGIYTFTRPLRYQKRIFEISDGISYEKTIAREKGIDVRIALDVVRLATKKYYDVALIFSQDQDLSEAVNDIHQLSKDQRRWIKIASCFPASPDSTNNRGINDTDWIPMDKATYDKCIDPRDYRPKKW